MGYTKTTKGYKIKSRVQLCVFGLHHNEHWAINPVNAHFTELLLQRISEIANFITDFTPKKRQLGEEFLWIAWTQMTFRMVCSVQEQSTVIDSIIQSRKKSEGNVMSWGDDLSKSQI